MINVPLDAGLAARLAELARACEVPPSAVALTALALLQRRYTGQTTCHGLDLTGDTTVAQTLARAAHLPPTDLLIPARHAADLPAALSLEAGRAADLATDLIAEAGRVAEPPPGVVAEAGRAAGRGGQGEVGWEPAGAGAWQIRLECEPELAESMAIDLRSMVEAMAADPHRSTADLLPVAHYERRRPLETFEPSHPNVAAAFADIAARYPDHVAVLTDAKAWTYRELASAVTATARQLGPGGPVALLCQHGPNAVIGLLAALAAGRPYVPLDPDFPKARLAGIVADCAADTVLVGDELGCLARELAPDAEVVRIGQPQGEPDLATLRGRAQLDDPAYVLYTSGSTGKPKGVVQSHRNILFSIANHLRHFAITPADRTSVLTSFGYDMAVTDTFAALLCGAAAVPVDVRTHGLTALAATLARHRVSIYHSTPTVFRYLMALEQPLPDVRVVLLGGEEVTRHDAALARARCAPQVMFVNGYGATEISFITQYHVPRGEALDRAVMPVGHPLHGVDVVLVDSARRPVCLNGEVLACSEHVALGYWNQPTLTSQRFIEYGGTRAYLTGDVASRLPDGRLVFLARADRMVKIRGHRVELGEVEAQLAAAPSVAHAAVVARRNPAGDMEIIAYAVPRPAPAAPSQGDATAPSIIPAGVPIAAGVHAVPAGGPGAVGLGVVPAGGPGAVGLGVVPAGGAGGVEAEGARSRGTEPVREAGSGFDPVGLRAELGRVLPDFMVPRAIVEMASLPMGPTGKLDVAALPDPPAPGVAAAPGTALERLIGDAWCEVLGLAAIDRQASVVHLGAHSLQMAVVQRRLEQTLGRRLPIARLFEFPTVAALAGHLSGDSSTADEAARRAAQRMRERRRARS